MSFGKTGTYTYYCVLHPNMVGTVTVTGDTQDSQQKITKTGNQEKAKYLKEGEAAKKKLLSAKPKQTKNSDGSTTYTVEMGASTAHTDVLTFAPTPRNVKTGDQVTFVNNSTAPHTASFGGAARADHPHRRQRRGAPARAVTPGAGPGRVPQHRMAAAEDEGRSARCRRAATPTRCPAPGKYTVRVRPAPPEWDGGRDRRDLISRGLTVSVRSEATVFGADCCPVRGGTVMDRHERIEDQLAKVPLFSGLSKKELKLISQLATYLEEPAGTVLTEEGKPGHEFIIVLDGEIEVRQGGKVVAERGAGAYVGRDRAARPPAAHGDRRGQDPGGDRGHRPAGVRRPAGGGPRALAAAARHRGPPPRRSRPEAGTVLSRVCTGAAQANARRSRFL